MLNVYKKYERPESLDGYGEKYPLLVALGKLKDNLEILTSEDEEVLSRHINVIIKDPNAIYMYALYVIKGRFEEAEPNIIMKLHSYWSYRYVIDVIKGRWEEAEPYIMKDPTFAYSYAQLILSKDPEWLRMPGHERGRWPEAEPYIKEDPKLWINYVNYFKVKE